MTSIPIHLAVEDQLSEAALRRILCFVDRGYCIGTAYRKNGNGYLRRSIKSWNKAAQGTPFAVLTDLDDIACPSALISTWLSSQQHPNLIFRVAVREVESWLLADAGNLSAFLKVKKAIIPNDPESLRQPKEYLVDIARKSNSREIRNRLVPNAGSTAKQGRDYNSCLIEFVDGSWDLSTARNYSRSLDRAIAKFECFEPTW